MLHEQIIQDRYRDVVIIGNVNTCVKRESKVRTQSKPFFRVDSENHFLQHPKYTLFLIMFFFDIYSEK